MAYSSRVKDALDDIVTELGTISTTNGYYTNPTVVRAIRHVDRITKSPEIGVEIGEEEMSPMDDNAKVFQSEVFVYIAGTATANSPVDSDSSELVEETEKLRHDIKRIVSRMFYKYSPKTNNLIRWQVLRGTVVVVPVMGLGERQNKAQVWARFKILIRNQHADTLAAGEGETYGSAGAGYYGF